MKVTSPIAHTLVVPRGKAGNSSALVFNFDGSNAFEMPTEIFDLYKKVNPKKYFIVGAPKEKSTEEAAAEIAPVIMEPEPVMEDFIESQEPVSKEAPVTPPQVVEEAPVVVTPEPVVPKKTKK